MKQLVLGLACLFSTTAFGQATLHDIGIIGLFSHDVFAWDHNTQTNTENGRVDLSTIFEYDGGSRWKKGGNPKNSENAPVYTVAMELVDLYKWHLSLGSSEAESRRATVEHFHLLVKESYARLRGRPFPESGLDQAVTNTEQATLRAMHDLLPGRVRLFDRPLRKTLKLTNFLTAKTHLNEKELAQEINPFDGQYDVEYRKIKMPLVKVKIDLQEVDRKFIETFSSYRQADMLAELAQVGSKQKSMDEVSFVHHIDELFQKALCPNGNEWMPQGMPCS